MSYDDAQDKLEMQEIKAMSTSETLGFVIYYLFDLNAALHPLIFLLFHETLCTGAN